METKAILFGCLSGKLLFAAACSDNDLYSRDETSPTVGIDDTSLTFEGKTEEAKILIKTNIWWKAHVEYDGGGRGVAHHHAIRRVRQYRDHGLDGAQLRPDKDQDRATGDRERR